MTLPVGSQNVTITMLDHSMFETDKFACLNFWVTDTEGTRQVSETFVEELGLKDAVLSNYDQGYLDLSKSELVYGGLQILQIQWG